MALSTVRAIIITPRLLGGKLRAGDMLGACNFLEFIRQQENDSNLRWYLPIELIHPQPHCMQMYSWLLNNTDYFTEYCPGVCPPGYQFVNLPVIPGTDATYNDMYNIWNIREDVLTPRQRVFNIPDTILLPNHEQGVWGKTVICPVMDAEYNHDRNWSLSLLQELVNNYDRTHMGPKCILSKEEIPGLNPKSFTYSHDYAENLKHIQTCQSYIGGDTGLSHFAGSLETGPTFRTYFYPDTTYGPVCPLRWKHNSVLHLYCAKSNNFSKIVIKETYEKGVLKN